MEITDLDGTDIRTVIFHTESQKLTGPGSVSFFHSGGYPAFEAHSSWRAPPTVDTSFFSSV